MPHQITFSLHTENGAYNPAFNWGNIQKYLDFLARYKDVVFVRSNNGRIKFINAAASPQPGWAMWTTRATFTTRIAPNFNFKNIDLVCARCILHEFFHMCSALDHLPGTVSLMTTTGGTCGNITEADYQYISAYAWKSALRPHQEPNKMAQTFAAPLKFSTEGEFAPSSPVFGCEHKSPWYHKLIPSRFMAP
jgi:hypothetical protein